ncbi:hypothetical protein [Aquimarina brevivitae]|uniref:Uncharacterized protein n=1 Tax=Aquimarina brevivitae TaxID=323412 RepID=A0A4Q7PEM7_9FLAO|nr:hypothetical protein [Aquimarina brevivitae]RZS98913.1 hypothetical protein EV197_0114 [Aquimarina brevivitae]
MSAGGGSGHNLSNLLRNSRRQKREAYDGWRASDKESQGIKKEPVSDELLQEIRHKLRKQRSTLFLKRLVACIIIFCAFITFIGYISMS